MKLIVSITMMFLVTCSFAQVQWTSIHDLDDSLKVKEKPEVVKIYTDWCGYCKMMDAKIFENKGFTKKVGSDYYFVALNAERNEKITFNGVEYNYLLRNGGRGIQKLALQLGEVEGRISYPTVVLLNPDYSQKKKINGYVRKPDFLFWLNVD